MTYPKLVNSMYTTMMLAETLGGIRKSVGRKVARIQQAMASVSPGKAPGIAIDLNKCPAQSLQSLAGIIQPDCTEYGLILGPVALESLHFDDEFMYINSTSLGNEPHILDGTPSALKIDIGAIYGTYIDEGEWTNLFYVPEQL